MQIITFVSLINDENSRSSYRSYSRSRSRSGSYDRHRHRVADRNYHRPRFFNNNNNRKCSFITVQSQIAFSLRRFWYSISQLMRNSICRNYKKQNVVSHNMPITLICLEICPKNVGNRFNNRGFHNRDFRNNRRWNNNNNRNNGWNRPNRYGRNWRSRSRSFSRSRSPYERRGSNHSNPNTPIKPPSPPPNTAPAESHPNANWVRA